MPFKSKSQMKKFFAMERSGEMKKGTAIKWARETKDMEKMPMKMKAKAKAKAKKKK